MKDSAQTSTYPIDLDLRGRTVLVVGLGAVGARKAARLIEAGARVVGIDPGRPEGVPAGVEHRVEAFRAEHLEGEIALVFAAATAEVNRRVVAEARRAGVWVNAASEPELGDFAVPAVWREGLVTLTVSTSGASPALARAARDRAAAAIGAAPALAALIATLRPRVLERIGDPETRRGLLAGWGDARWLDAWTSDGPEAVRLAWLAALDEAERAGRSLHESPDIS